MKKLYTFLAFILIPLVLVAQFVPYPMPSSGPTVGWATGQPIVPADYQNLGAWAVIDGRMVRGGLHQVSSIAERNNIPAGVRTTNMWVKVMGDNTGGAGIYVLQNDLSTWLPLTFGAGLDPSSCNALTNTAGGIFLQKENRFEVEPSQFVFSPQSTNGCVITYSLVARSGALFTNSVLTTPSIVLGNTPSAGWTLTSVDGTTSNLAWAAPGGGGGTTIYSGDGTISGTRTVAGSSTGTIYWQNFRSFRSRYVTTGSSPVASADLQISDSPLPGGVGFGYYQAGTNSAQTVQVQAVFINGNPTWRVQLNNNTAGQFADFYVNLTPNPSALLRIGNTNSANTTTNRSGFSASNSGGGSATPIIQLFSENPLIGTNILYNTHLGMSLAATAVTPIARFDNRGSTAWCTTVVTGNTTLGDCTVYVFTGTTATFTLPSASSGLMYQIVNHGTGNITTSASFTTANGVTTTTVGPGTSVRLIHDGTVWRQY